MMKSYTKQEKHKILNQVNALRGQGMGVKKATEQVGVALSTYHSWTAKLGEEDTPKVIVHTPDDTTKRKYTKKLNTNGDSFFVIVANSSNLKQIMASLS